MLQDGDGRLIYEFARESIFTLSYDVVPYLFVLLEAWEGTDLEESLRIAIDMMLGYSDHVDFLAPLGELEDFSKTKLSNYSPEYYYIFGEKLFPASLAKYISSKAQYCLGNKEPL